MDVLDALVRRRMTRSFDGSQLDEDRLVELCEAAMRAPTAGNARGVDAVVLAGSAGVSSYLDAATDPEWRASSPRAAGFARAGGAVVVTCDPDMYAARYAAPDKARSGLGDASAWPVPYWYTDAAFFTMALLLLAEASSIAACFLGAFRREPEVLAAVRAPSGARLFGAVLLGSAGGCDAPSGSIRRAGRTRAERVQRRSFPPTA